MKKIIATVLAFVMLLGTMAIGVPEEGFRLNFGLTAYAVEETSYSDLLSSDTDVSGTDAVTSGTDISEPEDPAPAEIASGTCGNDLTWVLTDDGKLSISGSGKMKNWPYSSAVPWYSYRSQIKTVEMSGATSIGNYAFYNSYLLATVTISNSVTSIGSNAFRDCTSLASVTIPDSVTTIGDYAFYYCTSLASVTIPDSVTSIGESAFDHCRSLTSVTIGDSVTSIGAGAFYYCTSLTGVTIPDSVTSIGNSAFYGCTSLTSITIPDSVTSIGYAAFSHCSSLTRIIVDEDNQCFSSIDGIIYDKKAETLICWPAVKNGSITIPDSVTSIGDCAFSRCSSLTSITIPDSVTSIGYAAFSHCSSLTSITIPDSVTSIGNYAFYDCTSLTSVTICNPNCTIYDASYTISSSATIYGYTNSTAQAYAEKYNRKFVVLSEIADDPEVDESATISIYDTSKKVMEGNTLVLVGNIYASVDTIDAVCDTINWSVSDESVVRVDSVEFLKSTGSKDDALLFVTFTGKSTGTATITCTLANGSSDSFVVEVLPQKYRMEIAEGGVIQVEGGSHVYIRAMLTEEDQYGKTVVSKAGGELVVEVSDESVVSAVNDGTRNNITDIKVYGIKSGNAVLTITDPVTGASAFVFVTSSSKPLGHRIDKLEPVTYTTKFLWNTIYETAYIYNVNGIYVDTLEYKKTGDEYEITMDVYNSNYSHAAIDIYDKDGTWQKSKLIEKYDATVSSLGETVSVGSGLLFDTLKGELLTYKQDSYTKHTRVKFTVPEDGYFVINTGSSNSSSVLLYNLFDFAISSIDLIEDCTSIEQKTDALSSLEFESVLIDKLSDAGPLKDAVKDISIKSSPAVLFDKSVDLIGIVEDIIGENFGDFVVKNLKRTDKLAADTLEEIVTEYGGLSGLTLKALFIGSELLGITAQLMKTGTLAENHGIYIDMPVDGNRRSVSKSGFTVSHNDAFFKSDIVLRVENKWSGSEYDSAVSRFSSADNISVFDISLADGKQVIQPDEPVSVSVPIPEGVSADECSVFRLEANGSYTDMKAKPENGKLVFTTDHFSIYVLIAGNIARTPGDINSDGEVNLLDSTVLRRWLAGWDVTISEANADVNGDGKVDMKDSVLLRRYLAGWNGVELR